MLSIRQVQCFVATVDCGSVTAAAKRLGISPQAVSRMVNQLERSIGRSLFVRRASGLKPTPAGLSLYKKANRTLEEIDSLEKTFQVRSTPPRSHLDIELCIPRTANFSYMSQKISNFLAKGTGIAARVGYGSYERCVQRLDMGSADAIITIGETCLDDYEVNVIDRVDVGALMVDDNPLAAKDLLALPDLEEMPLYLSPGFAFFNDTMLETLKDGIDAARLEFRALKMSIFGIYDALAKQSGCVIMPSIPGIDEWLPQCSTVPIDSHDVPRVPLCLVTPMGDKSSYCAAIEELLLPQRSERFSISRIADA